MYALVWTPQGYEWLIILAIVVLLFGAKKLPELAKNSGKALKNFKEETKDLRKSDDEPKSQELTQGTQAPEQQLHPPVQAPSQQAAPQPQPQSQERGVNGQAPGDSSPPSSN
jgi:sec-independent protein translocase protein TatA